MRSGQLDKSIIIQAKTATQDASGQEVETWTKIHTGATLPAAVISKPGGESFGAEQVIAFGYRMFKIRYRADVTVLNRIVYNGRNYDVLDVREVSRRDGLEIDAKARAETGTP